MPKYFYTAKSQKGKPKSGNLQAKDEYELARILRSEGYVLISADPEGESKKKHFKIKMPFSFFNSISLKDKMIFTRNLQTMINAGVSLPRSLRTLALQAKNKKLKKALLEIVEDIIKGTNFSDSLAKQPEVFSELFCNMVKVGEESGTLEENLSILTRQMERENELKSKIKGAMVYPAVIIAAMIGIGILMLVMVVPKLAQTFEELGTELPFTTRAVIFLGTFLAEKWYFVILIVTALLFLTQIVLKNKKGKKTIDNLILKIPIVSSIIKKTNSAYTVRTLSSLIGSGVSLVRSLEIVSGVLGNFYFKQSIIRAKERVKKGEKLSVSLKPYKDLYPATVIQMIEVGEETGQTAETLQKLADFFEEEVANATKNLTTVIEPILMLIIGGTVGFFAISMVQPMYSMLGALK
ncbi:MAG: type II secretion system F family protein [Candidatus Nealsonbacteria bacterium]